MIKEGSFKNDLFYRLDGYTICIPSLRDRREDFEEILRYHLDMNCAKLGRSKIAITAECIDRLAQCSWRGNIRDLSTVLRKAIIDVEGDRAQLTEADFRRYLAEDAAWPTDAPEINLAAQAEQVLGPSGDLIPPNDLGKANWTEIKDYVRAVTQFVHSSEWKEACNYFGCQPVYRNL